ncbi:hypothetical protein GLE_2441 [Lysobacter enzymogenes]|uniref:Uncharacterized protein n=1 Tax=Lysobacter enzymogenes TaxID=69 RepID=A0A0S2DHC2_LYSEN|nr:hypothetical protein GLE_2441 [Lysobacter enzymogenes]
MACAQATETRSQHFTGRPRSVRLARNAQCVAFASQNASRARRFARSAKLGALSASQKARAQGD